MDESPYYRPHPNAKSAASLSTARRKKDSAEITADENILPAIKTEKKGSALIISRRQKFKCQNAPVISVTLKTAEKISISGKTELLISGVLKGKDIEIYAKKNSEVRGKFRFTSAAFNLQGKSYVLADGYCGKLAIINAGDGFFDGRKLSSGECSIDTAGRLEAMISAEQKLSIKSFGGIELFYAGKPKVKKSVSGDAKIHRVKTFAKIPVTP